MKKKEQTRRKMMIRLKQQNIETNETGRTPNSSDTEMLAQLILQAYRNTIDDEEETIEDARQEIQMLFKGEYGALLTNCSDVVAYEDKLISATLLTLWQDAPLIAFTMTHPEWKRMGLARKGLKRTINRLLQAGYKELYLVVTRGNYAAEKFYESFGFCDVIE